MRKLHVIPTVAALLMATTVGAAPVRRTVNAVLTIENEGLASLRATGTGTVTVDTATGTIQIPAGLVTLTARVVVPVTATTAISSLTATGISNQAGTLSIGGATNQLPGEVCPSGPPDPTGLPACVLGGGSGGRMGLHGAQNVVVPSVGTLALDLNRARIGQGGSTNIPFALDPPVTFLFDGAAWTSGVGAVPSSMGTETVQGTGSPRGSSVTFVTPTFTWSPQFTSQPFLTNTSLTLDFVPEPGTLLMLCAGVAGLVWLGYRRR